MTHIVYDILGVGFGPSNIALAVALEENFPELRAHFVEAGKNSQWQSNMMIVGADIQHNPHMDLATPRNPQSYYSFNNFLHKTGRMFQHYNLGLEYPLRQEYSDYVLWASEFFAEKVDYNTRITKIAAEKAPYSSEMVYRVTSADGNEYLSRTLVVATGRPTFIPEIFDDVPKERQIHLTEYLPQINKLGPKAKSVAIIGASQSAVEIILDLTERFPHLEVSNYIRHFAYRQKDLSPQMEASIYPEYVKEHYDRTWEQRHRFNEDLKYQNYSSADFDVLQDLNTRSYVHQLNTGKGLYNTFNNSEIKDVSYSEEAKKTTIIAQHIYTSEIASKEFDLVILATGFRDMGVAPHQDKIPPLLKDISDNYVFDKQGVVQVSFDYELKPSAPQIPPVYLNGLCEGTHGVSDAGSFSLLALRTEKIASGLARKLTSVLHEKTG